MVSLIVRKAFEPFIAVYHDMLKSLINLGEIFWKL